MFQGGLPQFLAVLHKRQLLTAAKAAVDTAIPMDRGFSCPVDPSRVGGIHGFPERGEVGHQEVVVFHNPLYPRAGDRNRTRDLLLTRQPLCLLSYTGMCSLFPGSRHTLGRYERELPGPNFGGLSNPTKREPWDEGRVTGLISEVTFVLFFVEPLSGIEPLTSC